MIELVNVSKTFDNRIILDNINSKFEYGNIYGLLGNNGAGKTTMMKMIFGEIEPSKGTIFFEGKSVLGANKEKWFFFSETSDMPETLTVKEYYEEICFLSNKKQKWFFSELNKNNDFFDLDFSFKQKVGDLSSGQKKLMQLSALMIIKPNVICFDEPTANLDVKNKEIILNYIKKLHNQKNIIIIVTHLIREIENLVTDIKIVDDKKIVFEDRKNNIDDLYNLFVDQTT